MTAAPLPTWLLARSARGPVESLSSAEVAAAPAVADVPAMARRLRADGAHAVLALDAGGGWLDSGHATGRVGLPFAPAGVADRWQQGLSAGFIAADAALLALAAEGPLPALGWGEDPLVQVPARAGVEGLYAIVDAPARLRQVVEAGVRTVQLRTKAPADADAAWWTGLRASLREGLAIAEAAGVTLWINDHWRLAAELGARAVHLGQEDLAALGAQGRRDLAASGLALGVSSHAVWELCRARGLAPAYVACGPVWATTTKDMPWHPQGLHNLAWWCGRAGTPVVAIGGILEADQVRATARAGAAAVCVLRGLGEDPRQAVPRLQAAFEEGRAQRDGAAPARPTPSLEPQG